MLQYSAKNTANRAGKTVFYRKQKCVRRELKTKIHKLYGKCNTGFT